MPLKPAEMIAREKASLDPIEIASPRRDRDPPAWASALVAQARLRQRCSSLSLHDKGRPAPVLPVRHVRRAREKVPRIHALSGTTGKPTAVGYTANDIALWPDVMARSMRRKVARSVGKAKWAVDNRGKA